MGRAAVASAGLLLDTHVWLWAVAGAAGMISGACEAAIEGSRGAGRLFVSTVSVREVALLVARGRLRLGSGVGDWVTSALEPAGIRPLALEVTPALLSAELPGDFHRDPADQMLVAQAMAHGLTLVTRDETILAWARGGRVRVRDCRA